MTRNCALSPAASACFPITTGSPTRSGRQIPFTPASSAALRLTSGPIPAGSPVARAIRGSRWPRLRCPVDGCPRREVAGRAFDVMARPPYLLAPSVGQIRRIGAPVKRHSAALAGVIGALLLAIAPASAQEWPARPVKIIAPFAPGGSADTLGRIIAEQLSEAFKQQFFVENKPGAGGVVGSQQASHGETAGYTFCVP